ncbi:MAG: DUF169 domain-containing protein [bacterium]|nr:DUF169 domain-containing protein [bacterium]
MDVQLKQKFIECWNKYFVYTELPLVFYYTDEEGRGELAPTPAGWSCVITDLVNVQHTGKSIYFDEKKVACAGGKRYFGFLPQLRPNFEYFLSYGIPGKMEGERYKKTPELVKEHLVHQLLFEAPAKYIVFKRWDNLEEQDEPLAVIFFAQPDILSGLFTLTNFDEPTPYGVFAPFGSGCSSVVYFPYKESQAAHPKAVLGMFDISARLCVQSNVLSFSIPMEKFIRMVNNMDESFLITESWKKVKERIQ